MLSAMTLRGPLAAVLTGLALAACGASSSPQSSAGPPTSTTTTPATSQATSTAPAASSSPSSTASTTTTTNPGAPPEASGGSGKKAKPHPTVSSGADFPAAYLITADGKLTPPTVAGPSGLSISLAVDNRDHAAHTVVLVAPKRRTLHVPGGAGNLMVVRGLAAGTYRLLLDGRPAAQLVIGAAGGP